MGGKMKKTCVICGKEHHHREFTCSDECHKIFVDGLIKEFGEFKEVVDAETGKMHKVPTINILERGLKHKDLKNYPIIKDCS